MMLMTNLAKASTIFSAPTHMQKPTLDNVLDGPTDTPIKGTGISRALEGQPKLLIIDLPVVKDGVDLVVYDVLL